MLSCFSALGSIIFCWQSIPGGKDYFVMAASPMIESAAYCRIYFPAYVALRARVCECPVRVRRGGKRWVWFVSRHYESVLFFLSFCWVAG